MTRSENMEHVEVLRQAIAELRQDSIPTLRRATAVQKVESVIASLSAPQPPTEAQGGGEVEGLVADLETIWHSVSDNKETNAAYQRLKTALSSQPPAEAQAQGGGGASVLRTAAEYHYAQAACPRVQSGNTSSHRNPRLEAWHRQVADAIASVTAPPAGAQPVAWRFYAPQGVLPAGWTAWMTDKNFRRHAEEEQWPAEYAYPLPISPVGVVDVDALAQEIRRVDGEHSLGASALAEALVPYLTRAALAQQPAAVCHCYTTDPTNCIGTDDLAGLDCPCKCHAQQPAACVGCEGKPSPENTPCAVCGQQSAAVDDAMVTRAVNAYDEATGEGWQMPCLQGMRAALTAALAAQQGGDHA